MGNEESSTSQSEYIFGLRITGIDINSPLHGKVNLYTDFIRQINNFKNMKAIQRNTSIFPPNQPTTLQIYNIIDNKTRELQIELNAPAGAQKLEQALGIRFSLEESECAWMKIMRVMTGKRAVNG
jgi:regulator of sigma D